MGSVNCCSCSTKKQRGPNQLQSINQGLQIEKKRHSLESVEISDAMEEIRELFDNEMNYEGYITGE